MRILFTPSLLLAVLIQAVFIAYQPTYATALWQEGASEIGTHGTLRLVGSSLPKEAAACFTAPGAGAKYRLGNECDDLFELSGYYHYQAGQDRSYFHVEREEEAKWPNNVPFSYTGILQSYAEMGNIADTPIDFWIGQRKNKRRKVFINDFYYMNTKGKGLGLRDIPLGTVKLAYSYTRSYATPAINGLSPADLVKQSNHDFSLYDLPSNPGGFLTLDFRYSRIASNTFADTGVPINVHGAHGWAFALQHEQDDFLEGTNKVVLQYGAGAARDAWSQPDQKSSVLAKLVTSTDANNLESARTWRLLDSHLTERARWAMMSDVIIEKRDSRHFDGTDQIWLSAGGRPTYFIDGHWQITAELGYDQIKSAALDGNLRKGTLAVEWVLKRSSYIHPLVRTYVTHAAWSSAFTGRIGGAAYAVDTQAWSGGIQTEAKW